MNKKVLEIGAKILLPVFLFVLIVLFVKLSIEDERDKESLYRVDFGDQRVWTKEIIMVDNGGIEFVDVKSKRKYSVHGNYAVINPKNK